MWGRYLSLVALLGMGCRTPPPLPPKPNQPAADPDSELRDREAPPEGSDPGRSNGASPGASLKRPR